MRVFVEFLKLIKFLVKLYLVKLKEEEVSCMRMKKRSYIWAATFVGLTLLTTQCKKSSVDKRSSDISSGISIELSLAPLENYTKNSNVKKYAKDSNAKKMFNLVDSAMQDQGLGLTEPDNNDEVTSYYGGLYCAPKKPANLAALANNGAPTAATLAMENNYIKIMNIDSKNKNLANQPLMSSEYNNSACEIRLERFVFGQVDYYRNQSLSDEKDFKTGVDSIATFVSTAADRRTLYMHATLQDSSSAPAYKAQFVFSVVKEIGRITAYYAAQIVPPVTNPPVTNPPTTNPPIDDPNKTTFVHALTCSGSLILPEMKITCKAADASFGIKQCLNTISWGFVPPVPPGNFVAVSTETFTVNGGEFIKTMSGNFQIQAYLAQINSSCTGDNNQTYEGFAQVVVYPPTLDAQGTFVGQNAPATEVKSPPIIELNVDQTTLKLTTIVSCKQTENFLYIWKKVDDVSPLSTKFEDYTKFNCQNDLATIVVDKIPLIPSLTGTPVDIGNLYIVKSVPRSTDASSVSYLKIPFSYQKSP